MSRIDVIKDHKRTNSALDSSEYFQKSKQYFDVEQQVTIIKIFAGEWSVSSHQDVMFVTILGSCVSACIRDPVARVGGMNHFMLPGTNESTDNQYGTNARYGVNAMELLINDLLKAGASKERFEVKVFGGGNIINNSARIGSMNAQFIHKFLDNEGLRIVAADLEGDYPRRIHYFPKTGIVKQLLLRRSDDEIVMSEENRYRKSVINALAKAELVPEHNDEVW